MITPAELIAELDMALAEAGEDVTVRRYTAASPMPRPKIEAEGVPAFVRALKADELVGAMDQTWSHVVISPTLIGALIPIKKNDKLVIQGRERNVELPLPILVQGSLVRLELMVSG